MLRRCCRRAYRYQEFVMHGKADNANAYPREAPNTSVFPQYLMNIWMGWGFTRQEVWLDCSSRRYQTFWQILRTFLLLYIPLFYIFPFGLPKYFAEKYSDEYGMCPYLKNELHLPFDNMYVERVGRTLHPEWLRHIHSKESYERLT